MTKSKFFLFAIILVFRSVASSQSSREIMENYINAIGGKERIDSVETATLKVNLSSSHATSATCITSLKRDYKFRISLSFEDGRNSIHCYDGVKNTGSNKVVIAMGEALNKRPKKFIVFNEVIFVSLSDLKNEPDEVINGIKCSVVSHDDVEWKQFYKYYFDKETHLLIAEDSSGYPTFYENYQSTGGILFPMRSRQTVNEVESITEYTEIILNPELPDDIFECNPK
jgi:outer membrane lipoprotein-sorting protein